MFINEIAGNQRPIFGSRLCPYPHSHVGESANPAENDSRLSLLPCFDDPVSGYGSNCRVERFVADFAGDVLAPIGEPGHYIECPCLAGLHHDLGRRGLDPLQLRQDGLTIGCTRAYPMQDGFVVGGVGGEMLPASMGEACGGFEQQQTSAPALVRLTRGAMG